MAREDLLARTFVELADIFVDDFDLVDVTQMMVERCVELFDASAAGLLLAEPERGLQVLASSSEELRVVELFEVQASEGPCLDCYRFGEPVVNQDLNSSQERWPRFAPVAMGAGFHSVHALPVRLRGQVVGALNLFRADAGKFNDADILAAQALADAAAIPIVQQRAVHDGQLLINQLQTALSSRIVIEQAKGMLAERAKLGIDAAFVRIRMYARGHNQQLTLLCQAVVQGTIDIDEVAGELPHEHPTSRSRQGLR